LVASAYSQKVDESSGKPGGGALTVAGERKQLEDASARFVAISQDLLAISGYDGHLKWINPSYEALTGRTEDELVGKRQLDLFHPGDRGLVAAEIATLVDHGGGTASFEARVRSGSGSFRWFLFTLTASPEEQLLYSVGKDVTHRRYDEEALREAEERFRAAFEQAPIGMAMVSIEQERPGCFLRVNRSLCDITGYSPDELIGTDFGTIVHREEIEPDFHYVRWMLMGEIAQYEVEKQLRHADGHLLSALVTVSLV
jgi:PAS domain S-box-containing protein